MHITKLFVPLSGRSAIFKYFRSGSFLGGQKPGGDKLDSNEDGSLDTGMAYPCIHSLYILNHVQKENIKSIIEK